MTDYSQDFKKSAAKSFIESKYSPARFCVTFSNRNIDPMLLIEWVKDLAISVQCDIDFWHEQSNKQNVIINNLDAENEGLHLKINQLAEHNAMLATAGIEKDKQIINCNLQLTQLFNENEKLKNQLDQMYDTMCRNKQNSIVDIADDIVMNSDLLAENKKLKDRISTLTNVNMRYCENENRLLTLNQSYQDEIEKLNIENQQLKAKVEDLKIENKLIKDENTVLQLNKADFVHAEGVINNYTAKCNQLQSENQSLMAEIEELKSMAGHRDNMQFIAICEKIVQDGEELKKHLEGGK